MSAPEERNWGAEPWRAPAIGKDDALIFSECGRVLDNVDYRSHWFVLTKCHSFYFLLVKHGGGEERLQIGWSDRLAQALAAVDSDNRYLLMHTMHKINSSAKQYAWDNANATYKKAFAEGRLKKRKVRGQAAVKVWIEPEIKS